MPSLGTNPYDSKSSPLDFLPYDIKTCINRCNKFSKWINILPNSITVNALKNIISTQTSDQDKSRQYIIYLGEWEWVPFSKMTWKYDYLGYLNILYLLTWLILLIGCKHNSLWWFIIIQKCLHLHHVKIIRTKLEIKYVPTSTDFKW